MAALHCVLVQLGKDGWSKVAFFADAFSLCGFPGARQPPASGFADRAWLGLLEDPLWAGVGLGDACLVNRERFSDLLADSARRRKKSVLRLVNPNDLGFSMYELQYRILNSAHKREAILFPVAPLLHKSGELRPVIKLLRALGEHWSELHVPQQGTSFFKSRPIVRVVYHLPSWSLLHPRSQAELSDLCAPARAAGLLGLPVEFISFKELFTLSLEQRKKSIFVLWNLLWLTEREHLALRELIREGGNWVHTWATGLLKGHDIDILSMARTNGMKIQILPGMNAQLYRDSRPLFAVGTQAGGERNKVMLPVQSVELAPAFVIAEQKEAIPLFRSVSGVITGAGRTLGHGRQIYLAAPAFSSALLRYIILQFRLSDYCFDHLTCWSGEKYLFLLAQENVHVKYPCSQRVEFMELMSGQTRTRQVALIGECAGNVPQLWVLKREKTVSPKVKMK